MTFRVSRLMYSDGWLYGAFMAFRVLSFMCMVMDGYIGHLWHLWHSGCRGSCVVMDGYVGHLWHLGC